MIECPKIISDNGDFFLAKKANLCGRLDPHRKQSTDIEPLFGEILIYAWPWI
jgi:hypothetical protein